MPDPALPPELARRLASAGARLHRRIALPPGELRAILHELSAIPVDRITNASREITRAAQLDSRWPPAGFSIRRFFGGPKTEQDLLDIDPDYAWLLIFHKVGYVRQAALDAIQTPPTSPFYFAALALRLNDWVEPVRRSAKRCAQRVLPLASTEVTLEAAPFLLDRRFVWDRWSDEKEVLDSAFSQKPVVQALAAVLKRSTTGPLASRLRFVLQFPAIDDHLPDLAANAREPAVRAVAYKCLLTRRASWPVGSEWIWIDKVYGQQKRVPKLQSRAIDTKRPIAELIREALRDRSAKVRTIAADSLIEARGQLPDEALLIERLAADRSPAVRLRADYLLQRPAG
jgi:hypothetical protein